jgi:hypothetical protein
MTTEWITAVDASSDGKNEDGIGEPAVPSTTSISAQPTAENMKRRNILLSEVSVSVVRMEIAHNHMSGQNSRLAQVHLTAAVPVPSEHSLLTRMNSRLRTFAWSSARIVLDSVLGKLATRQTSKTIGRLPESFVVCSRPFLKEYTDGVLRRGTERHCGSSNNPDNNTYDHVCRGLLPLILHKHRCCTNIF